MKSSILPILASLLASGAYATSSLADVCTSSYVRQAMPSNGTIEGIIVNLSSVTANPVYNASSSGQEFFPDATFDYCNVTVSYSHDGLQDNVNLYYWLPSPSSFQNRYLATGGGGFAINSGTGSLPGGIIYGAVAGSTDGGFGSFNNELTDVILYANGTLNYDALYMFGYRAIGEQTMIGKELAKNFYKTDEKIYTYYQGCSEGGRDGWSQVQKYPELYDGVIPGAPALRYGQQQVNHLTPNVMEQTMDYYPPPCELSKIVNATIEACDKLDGLEDGVVSRTDLCMLHFNVNSTIGMPYYCAASSGQGGPMGGMGGSTSSTPAQNGTVSAKGAALVQTMLDGLHDLQGRRAYISYRISAEFSDAQTQYNSDTDSFELSINSQSGPWVTKFLELVDADNLSTLDNVTYDTLRDWMELGWQRYEDVLQTTWPDLSKYKEKGGKILHFHGESDPSIPAGSSVHYYDSVRTIMFPDQSYNASVESMNDFYRLYLIPGAAHCSTNQLQPNGPFPQTNLAVMIDWVENGNAPNRLNATHLGGDYKGQSAEICPWPLRPLWTNNGTTLNCVFDQASLNTWNYKFDAYKLPLY